jgi:asparagine synthase (glutamine-hydrolysing)
MCGISGVFKFNDSKINKYLFSQMVESQQHRGPDNTSYVFGSTFAMAHNRLSIMDLREVSNQPMSSRCGKYTIVYNGEVYNFRDLRTKLETYGVTFDTESDTEVVLLAFIHFGVESFKLLNGMFAFCIHDEVTNISYLVRDRFGIKPLYIAQNNEELIYASELGSILKYYHGHLSANKESLAEYMWYGTPLNNNTIYEQIKEQAPGSWLEISEHEVKEFRFFSYESQSKKIKLPDNHAANLIQDGLRKAVHRQLESDVPLGIFLSGGIDSTAIVALASERNDKLKTYSVSFDYSSGRGELEAAAKTAKQFNTEHHEINITGAKILDCIEKLNIHHAQPFADAANIPLLLMTEAVKNDVKVVLQGDGGDEIFGGYSIYRTFQQSSRWKFLKLFPQLVHKLKLKHPEALRLARFVSAINSEKPYLVNAKLLTMDIEESSPIQLLSCDLRNHLSDIDPFQYFNKLYMGYPDKLDDLEKIFLTDMYVQLKEVFLKKVDRSTMANSVEVRVPFLDNDLVNLALQLPAKQRVKGGVQKYLLKQALLGVVPNHILFGKKKGFGVPYAEWLRTDLKEAFLDNLNSEIAKEILDVNLVQKMFNMHCEGKGYNGFKLWKIFIMISSANKNNRFSNSIREIYK